MRKSLGCSLAREGARINLAPRSARGLGSAGDVRPRRRPLQISRGASTLWWPPPRPRISFTARFPAPSAGLDCHARLRAQPWRDAAVARFLHNLSATAFWDTTEALRDSN